MQHGVSTPVSGPTVCVIERSCRLSPARIVGDLQEAEKTKPAHPTAPQGPPSPYVGERRSKASMSSRASNFPVGDAQRQCAFVLSNRKVNPIRGDGLIEAKWVGRKYDAESPRPRGKVDDYEKNQGNSDLDCWCRSGPICQWLFWVMNGELWELYFRTCTASVEDQKLAESAYMICFFEL